MTPEENIEAALFGRVVTLETTPALPVVWPNVAFTPPAGSYLRFEHLPNRNERPFLGAADPSFRRGILQLTVVTPLNQGPTVFATRLAGKVAQHFPAGLALYSEGIKVRITRAPDVTSAMKTDRSWDVPISVYYECFA